MKGRQRSFSVRYRTLLSLFVVAIIPICSVLIVFYNYNLEEVRQDVEQINISRVEQIRAGFEGERMSHFRLRQAFCDDSSLLPLLRRERNADQYQALGLLREYLTYRGAGGDVAILVNGGDRAFHRTGASNGDIYFRTILQVTSEEEGVIRAALEGMSVTASQAVLPLNLADGGRGLLFCYALPPYTDTDIFMLVALSPQEVTDLFLPLLGNLEGSAFLLNEEGAPIFSTGDMDAALLVAGLDFGQSRHVIPTQVEGEPYSVIYAESPKGGLAYGVAVAHNTYQTRVIKQTTLIWQVVLFALIVCVAAIVFLTMLSYRPVKRLLELSGAPSRGRIDEYDEIRKAMVGTRDRAELLEGALAMQRPYVLERILGYAINSQLTGEEASQLFAGMNLRFDHPCFFVICARIVSADGGKTGVSSYKAAVVETAEAMGGSDSGWYSLERLDDDRISVVVNCRETLDTKAAAELFRHRITGQLRPGFVFVLGVGSLSHGFDRLKDSLYEANVLAEALPDRPVSFAEEMESLPGGYRHLYPVREMMLCLQQLRQGDREAALASFGAICDQVEAGADNSLIFRHVSAYLVNAMTETVHQLSGERFQEQIRALMLAEEPAGFRQAAGSLIAGFCGMINEEKRSSNSRLREDLRRYVQENCTNPDLGLVSIAEAFGLSPYYVSRFFRDQTNVNLKDYIASLRIDKAKEWLTQTGRPVGDIVEGLGYQSASSFIRKFKASTGMTPGRYRELYGGKRLADGLYGESKK